MKVYIYGSRMIPVIRKCSDLIAETEGIEETPFLHDSDLAIAPLLEQFLSNDEINTPKIGTLIFHPSLLPRHRGKDAIKWAFKLNETYSGSTWFWADDGMDTGPICEMEVLAIKDGERPREYYERAVIPSAVRLLGYILNDLKNGVIRKREQIEEHSTYEKPLRKVEKT